MTRRNSQQVIVGLIWLVFQGSFYLCAAGTNIPVSIRLPIGPSNSLWHAAGCKVDVRVVITGEDTSTTNYVVKAGVLQSCWTGWDHLADSSPMEFACCLDFTDPIETLSISVELESEAIVIGKNDRIEGYLPVGVYVANWNGEHTPPLGILTLDTWDRRWDIVIARELVTTEYDDVPTLVAMLRPDLSSQVSQYRNEVIRRLYYVDPEHIAQTLAAMKNLPVDAIDVDDHAKNEWLQVIQKHAEKHLMSCSIDWGPVTNSLVITAPRKCFTNAFFYRRTTRPDESGREKYLWGAWGEVGKPSLAK